MQDPSGTGEDKVEIFWDPPKGEFTKYTLEIDKLNLKFRGAIYGNPGLSGQNSNLYLDNIYEAVAPKKLVDPVAMMLPSKRQIENLSYKLTRYTIMGLEPAEAYLVALGTKTGQVQHLTCFLEFYVLKNSFTHVKNYKICNSDYRKYAQISG